MSTGMNLMKLTLKVWRQPNSQAPGRMVTYKAAGISPDMSFLEMLDVGTTTCQLYMRSFKDGDTIHVEPWRAAAFPVIKDLVVDRSAFDRIMQAGGYTSVNTGSSPDGNALLIPQEVAEEAMDAAACIGCGACVASCRNASARLFVAAKVKHLGILPQGQPERARRVLMMVEAMDREGFGNCTNEYECEAVCPKEISASHIAFCNRDYLKAGFRKR